MLLLIIVIVIKIILIYYVCVFKSKILSLSNDSLLISFSGLWIGSDCYIKTINVLVTTPAMMDVCVVNECPALIKEFKGFCLQGPTADEVVGVMSCLLLSLV